METLTCDNCKKQFGDTIDLMCISALDTCSKCSLELSEIGKQEWGVKTVIAFALSNTLEKLHVKEDYAVSVYIL